MSSILKALKRVEAQAPRKDGDGPAAGRVDTREVIQNRHKRSLFFYRFSLSLAVIAVLALGGWVLWQVKPFSGEKTASSRPAAGEGAPLKVASLPGKGSPEAPAPAEKRPEPKPASKPIPKAPVSAAPVKAALERAQDPVPAVGETPDAGPGKAPGTGQAKMEPLDTSRLKLEAIVWSSNPDSRFAVVNGRIVRAGGAIEDVEIREVARDYVAVASGGRVGKLMFAIEE